MFNGHNPDLLWEDFASVGKKKNYYKILLSKILLCISENFLQTILGDIL